MVTFERARNPEIGCAPPPAPKHEKTRGASLRHEIFEKTDIGPLKCLFFRCFGYVSI